MLRGFLLARAGARARVWLWTTGVAEAELWTARSTGPANPARCGHGQAPGTAHPRAAGDQPADAGVRRRSRRRHHRREMRAARRGRLGDPAAAGYGRVATRPARGVPRHRFRTAQAVRVGRGPARTLRGAGRGARRPGGGLAHDRRSAVGPAAAPGGVDRGCADPPTTGPLERPGCGYPGACRSVLRGRGARAARRSGARRGPPGAGLLLDAASARCVGRRGRRAAPQPHHRP